VRQIHRGAPHVVDDAGPADQSADHIAGVDAGSNAKVIAPTTVEALDDALHLDGEVDGSGHAVQPRHVQSAAGQVAVVYGANRLDAKGFGRRIELSHQLVDDPDQFVAGQTDRDLVEADDVGEDDRHVLMLLGDGLLAVAVTLRNGFGHQRQQQSVVFIALLGEQAFLDLQISAHLVESDCEIADFISRGDRYRHLVVAGADFFRPGPQSPDGLYEHMGDQHREHAQDENQRRGRHDERPGECLDPGIGLGTVSGRQDRPAQI
jgi:hypothetical protein